MSSAAATGACRPATAEPKLAASRVPGLFTREPVAGSLRGHYRLRHDLWYEASLTKNARLLARLADLADDGATHTEK